MGKNKNKGNVLIIVTTVLVLLIGYITFNYDNLRRILLEQLASSLEEFSIEEKSDYFDNDEIDEGYDSDDVGGTLEEQEEYSADNNYNISDANQRLRNYLLDSMNKAFGYKVGGHIRVDVTTNDTGAVIRIYLGDIKTPEDRNIAIQSCQESDLNSLHDCILNTYSNYGFSINNLDLRLCDTFGLIILQSKGGNMNSSDKYIDLGL